MIPEWDEADKTAPVPFEQFVNGYHVQCDLQDDVAAYRIYLENNAYRLTFGQHDNWEDFAAAEIYRYLTK